MKFEELNEGQKKAFEVFKDALLKRNRHICINGNAGTGKTTLTKFIIEHLERNGELGVILAAPTHQAKKVLSKLAGTKANTIHSVLKINPTTYEEQSIFEQKEIPDMAKCRVLICDEASMYDKKLFNILMATVPSTCLIIALGDLAQIRPVEPNNFGDGQVSLFFSDKRFEQVHLQKVERSNIPIIDVATEIREGGWFRENLVDGHGVHAFGSQTPLKDFMTKYFSIVTDADMLFENRMYAYTNKSVDKLNSIIRNRLYQTETPFIKDEIIVMQEPFIKELQFDGKKFSEIIFNNGQLVRIKECRESSTFLSCRGVAAKQMITYWDLLVETAEDDEEYQLESIKVISDPSQMEKFQFFLAKTAETYKEMKASGRRPEWNDFWKAKRTFLKVKAFPCSTIHKGQGSSVNSSFIYTPCIHMADAELATQLAYVAVTRARYDVYYV